MSASRHPLLAKSGAFFLAAGFAARLLMPESAEHPVAEAMGIGLLVLGAGLVLLEMALRGAAPASVLALLLPLVLIPAAARFPRESLTIKRGIDVWAACMAGFAMREIARGPLRAQLRAAVATAAVCLALFGIAQCAFLRAEAAEVAHATHDSMTLDSRGLAFLNSWRSAATFISANAFAGVLLLLGMPVLFAAAAAIRSKAPAASKAGLVVLAAATLAGFACAGSAGATVAGIGGALVMGWRAASGRVRRTCLAVLLVLAAACIGAIVFVSLSDASLAGKLRTLQERVDYHRAGFRLLWKHWLFGAGLDRTRLLMDGVKRPGEAFSRYIHDWWLQGLVEGGLLFIPIALTWMLAIARGTRAASGPPASAGIDRSVPSGPSGPPALAGIDMGRTHPTRPWPLGLLAGALLALFLEPFVSLLPYSWAPPGALAAVTAAAFACIAWLVRRFLPDGPAFDRGLAAGCVAFALHGLMDFDLSMPGVMVAFAAGLALLPQPAPGGATAPRRSSRLAITLTAIYGVLCVFAPIAIVLLAETREHHH